MDKRIERLTEIGSKEAPKSSTYKLLRMDLILYMGALLLIRKLLFQTKKVLHGNTVKD